MAPGAGTWSVATALARADSNITDGQNALRLTFHTLLSACLTNDRQDIDFCLLMLWVYEEETDSIVDVRQIDIASKDSTHRVLFTFRAEGE